MNRGENGQFECKHGGWISGKATRLYTIWQAMKSRCYYKHHVRFKYYGGKGISVCDDWLDFHNFREWALSNGYTDNMSIDREDSDKNYDPSNCRFMTKSENSKRSIRKSHKTMGYKTCAA